MPDNSEYYNLIYWRDYYQSDFDACQSRIDNYTEQIDQLEAQKEIVSELKSQYRTNKNKTKRIKNDEHEWTGSTYVAFHSKLEDVVEADQDYFDNEASRVLESIKEEISSIRKSRRQERLSLTNLGAKIDSFADKIESFFD